MAKASNVALQAMYAGLGNPGDTPPAAKSEDSKWTIWEIGALIIAGGAAAAAAKKLLAKDREAGGQADPKDLSRREFLKRTGGGIISGHYGAKAALEDMLEDDISDFFEEAGGISKAEATKQITEAVKKVLLLGGEVDPNVHYTWEEISKMPKGSMGREAYDRRVEMGDKPSGRADIFVQLGGASHPSRMWDWWEYRNKRDKLLKKIRDVRDPKSGLRLGRDLSNPERNKLKAELEELDKEHADTRKWGESYEESKKDYRKREGHGRGHWRDFPIDDKLEEAVRDYENLEEKLAGEGIDVNEQSKIINMVKTTFANEIRKAAKEKLAGEMKSMAERILGSSPGETSPTVESKGETPEIEGAEGSGEGYGTKEEWKDWAKGEGGGAGELPPGSKVPAPTGGPNYNVPDIGMIGRVPHEDLPPLGGQDKGIRGKPPEGPKTVSPSAEFYHDKSAYDPPPGVDQASDPRHWKELQMMRDKLDQIEREIKGSAGGYIGRDLVIQASGNLAALLGEFPSKIKALQGIGLDTQATVPTEASFHEEVRMLEDRLKKISQHILGHDKWQQLPDLRTWPNPKGIKGDVVEGSPYDQPPTIVQGPPDPVKGFPKPLDKSGNIIEIPPTDPPAGEPPPPQASAIATASPPGRSIRGSADAGEGDLEKQLDDIMKEIEQEALDNLSSDAGGGGGQEPPSTASGAGADDPRGIQQMFDEVYADLETLKQVTETTHESTKLFLTTLENLKKLAAHPDFPELSEQDQWIVTQNVDVFTKYRDNLGPPPPEGTPPGAMGGGPGGPPSEVTPPAGDPGGGGSGLPPSTASGAGAGDPRDIHLMFNDLQVLLQNIADFPPPENTAQNLQIQQLVDTAYQRIKDIMDHPGFGELNDLQQQATMQNLDAFERAVNAMSEGGTGTMVPADDPAAGLDTDAVDAALNEADARDVEGLAERVLANNQRLEVIFGPGNTGQTTQWQLRSLLDELKSIASDPLYLSLPDHMKASVDLNILGMEEFERRAIRAGGILEIPSGTDRLFDEIGQHLRDPKIIADTLAELNPRNAEVPPQGPRESGGWLSGEFDETPGSWRKIRDRILDLEERTDVTPQEIDEIAREYIRVLDKHGPASGVRGLGSWIPPKEVSAIGEILDEEAAEVSDKATDAERQMLNELSEDIRKVGGKHINKGLEIEATSPPEKPPGHMGTVDLPRSTIDQAHAEFIQGLKDNLEGGQPPPPGIRPPGDGTPPAGGPGQIPPAGDEPLGPSVGEAKDIIEGEGKEPKSPKSTDNRKVGSGLKPGEKMSFPPPLSENIEPPSEVGLTDPTGRIEPDITSLGTGAKGPGRDFVKSVRGTMIDGKFVPPIAGGTGKPPPAGAVGAQWYDELLQGIGKTKVTASEARALHRTMLFDALRQRLGGAPRLMIADPSGRGAMQFKLAHGDFKFNAKRDWKLFKMFTKVGLQDLRAAGVPLSSGAMRGLTQLGKLARMLGHAEGMAFLATDPALTNWVTDWPSLFVEGSWTPNVGPLAAEAGNKLVDIIRTGDAVLEGVVGGTAWAFGDWYEKVTDGEGPVDRLVAAGERALGGTVGDMSLSDAIRGGLYPSLGEGIDGYIEAIYGSKYPIQRNGREMPKSHRVELDALRKDADPLHYNERERSRRLYSAGNILNIGTWENEHQINREFDIRRDVIERELERDVIPLVGKIDYETDKALHRDEGRGGEGKRLDAAEAEQRTGLETDMQTSAAGRQAAYASLLEQKGPERAAQIAADRKQVPLKRAEVTAGRWPGWNEKFEDREFVTERGPASYADWANKQGGMVELPPGQPSGVNENWPSGLRGTANPRQVGSFAIGNAFAGGGGPAHTRRNVGGVGIDYPVEGDYVDEAWLEKLNLNNNPAGGIR